MKTILKERKYTTEAAKKAVIEFIESFDFRDYNDLGYIRSNDFGVVFDATGNGDMHDTAYFELDKGRFRIGTFPGDNRYDYDKMWSDISSVFDGTCVSIDFKWLVASMEDFITRINSRVDKKEAEIAEFLAFAEAWKNSRKNA